MKSAVLLIIVLAIISVRVGTADDDLPKGKLGFPLGTYLRIEAYRTDYGKGNLSNLMVYRVNEQKLDTPIGIYAERIELDSLPMDKRCLLRGYETGKMIGQPPAIAKAAKEEGKPIPPGSQAGWCFSRYFVVLSVIEPKGLKLVQ